MVNGCESGLESGLQRRIYSEEGPSEGTEVFRCSSREDTQVVLTSKDECSSIVTSYLI